MADAEPGANGKLPVVSAPSKSITQRDTTRILYAFLCLPLIYVAVYLDKPATTLECNRPKLAGEEYECTFTSYLDQDGRWSYFKLLTKPNVTEKFNLVDLLTSHVLKPEESMSKQGKGRFGSKRAEEAAEEERRKSFGVEIGLASGVYTFWNDYPTLETATHQSRDIDDFIRDSSKNKRPIKGKFIHDPTVFDEILLIGSLCALIYVTSLTPFWEKLTITAGCPSILHLQQWTLLGSTHHQLKDDLDILGSIKVYGKSLALKLRKTLVPLIDAPRKGDAEKTAKEMNAYIKECQEYAVALLKHRRKNKKGQGDEEEDLIHPPETSFMQDTWDNLVTYLVPTLIALPPFAHMLGYTLFE